MPVRRGSDDRGLHRSAAPRLRVRLLAGAASGREDGLGRRARGAWLGLGLGRRARGAGLGLGTATHELEIAREIDGAVRCPRPLPLDRDRRGLAPYGTFTITLYTYAGGESGSVGRW